jgi:hypothetical protein
MDNGGEEIELFPRLSQRLENYDEILKEMRSWWLVVM